MLPRRLWPELNRWVTVTPASAGWSVALSMFAAGTILLSRFVDAVPSFGIAGVIGALTRASSGPIGLAALYLCYSSLYRGCLIIAGESKGDPVLELIDGAIARSRRASRDLQRRLDRQALEGPEVPDRLVDARAAGFPAADFVLIASRRKPEWTRGTVIVSADKGYRLHEPVERPMPGGLRTLYPMSEANDLEAVRRWVHYELPPLTRSHAAPQ